MRKTLTERDRRLLKLVGSESAEAREASVLLEKLRKLIAIIVRESDLQQALAPGGRLSPAVLKVGGLEQTLQQLLSQQGQQRRYQSIPEDRLRRWLILLEIQNAELRRRNQHLQKQCDAAWLESREGVPMYRLFEYYAATTPDERTEVEQRMEQDRVNYRAQKALEAGAQERRFATLARARRRNKAEQPAPVDWFAEMPVADPDGMDSYVLATGVDRTTINKFLAPFKARPVRKSRFGKRGQLRPLYGFDTSMRVLDRWLGHWLPQEPDRIANAIVSTLRWSLTRPHTTTQARSLRNLLATHFERVRDGITEPALRKQVRRWSPALLSDEDWQRLARVATKDFREAQRQIESENRQRDALLTKPLAALLSGYPA